MKFLPASIPLALAALFTAAGPLHAQGAGGGVSGVKVPTKDLERSLRYYQTYAGFRDGIKYNDFEHSLLPPEGSTGASIILFDTTRSQAGAGPQRAEIIISVADVSAIEGRLMSAGFPVRRVEYRGMVLVFTQDPDGNSIEYVPAIAR